MASLNNPNPLIEGTECSISFTDFPEDVQLCILSFLTQSEISAFACTSKRFDSLCRNDGKVWFAMCDRRWGSKTQIRKWGHGKISYKLLYKTLDVWEKLIGFWRRSGAETSGIQSPSLVFFEWGSSFITASRVSPSRNGTYNVIKAPFLWMGLSSEGQVLNFLDPDGRSEIPSDKGTIFECLENDLIPVNVSFVGITHFIVEEHLSFVYPSSPDQKKNGVGRKSSPVSVRGDELGVADDVFETDFGSPESYSDLYMSEMYQFFANRTSPVGDRSWRRRRRREKERMGKRKWEPQHFVKIVNCSPTPSRPLQGLWKGIYEEMNLGFYLVSYDDIGGIACRRVWNSSEHSASYGPVFWTSNTTFLESPFCMEEEKLYDDRVHLQSSAARDLTHEQLASTECNAVTRILFINSSYDLVIPHLVGTLVNPHHAEGRIWQYGDGTFGFGFLRDNFIIDLKHIFKNGCLLDAMKYCCD